MHLFVIHFIPKVHDTSKFPLLLQWEDAFRVLETKPHFLQMHPHLLNEE